MTTVANKIFLQYPSLACGAVIFLNVLLAFLIHAGITPDLSLAFLSLVNGLNPLVIVTASTSGVAGLVMWCLKNNVRFNSDKNLNDAEVRRTMRGRFLFHCVFNVGVSCILAHFLSFWAGIYFYAVNSVMAAVPMTKQTVMYSGSVLLATAGVFISMTIYESQEIPSICSRFGQSNPHLNFCQGTASATGHNAGKTDSKASPHSPEPSQTPSKH